MSAPLPSEPRLTPRAFAEWDEEDRATLLPFLRRPELYLSGAPDAPPMPVVLELFAHHRALSRTWLPFADMLSGVDARLDPALRELLILRVAWKAGSGYEWRSHKRLAAEAGLSAAQVDAVPAGPGANGWTPIERAMLTAADEMTDSFCVSDATWRTLASHLDQAELLEALFVVAAYLGLAAVLNSVGLEPHIDEAASPPGGDAP
jgi:4-carboxymuconolactone decarboxylase